MEKGYNNSYVVILSIPDNIKHKKGRVILPLVNRPINKIPV